MSNFILLHKISARTDDTSEVIIRKDKIDSIYERFDGSSQVFFEKNDDINVKETTGEIFTKLEG